MEIDRAGEGTIEYQDFCDLMSAKMQERDPVEEMRKAFRLFLDEESDKIQLRHLKRVAKELGETMAEEELQEMIDEADRDGDGEISEEELQEMIDEADRDG